MIAITGWKSVKNSMAKYAFVVKECSIFLSERGEGDSVYS
jgi:hypothetical protein